VETLVAALRSRILGGELQPGTPLREVEIAEGYGAARNAVRTAFQALVHEGLLQHDKHRGVFVAEPSRRSSPSSDSASRPSPRRTPVGAPSAPSIVAGRWLLARGLVPNDTASELHPSARHTS
jgi:DNA-binding transcriptional MocR family regulator